MDYAAEAMRWRAKLTASENFDPLVQKQNFDTFSMWLTQLGKDDLDGLMKWTDDKYAEIAAIENVENTEKLVQAAKIDEWNKFRHSHDVGNNGSLSKCNKR